MGDTCGLREANDLHNEHCDGEACVYWRAVEHLGEAAQPGCALQHFELLGDPGMARWLLSVKERITARATAGDAVR